VPDPSPWSRTRVRQVAPGKEVPGAGPPPWIVQPRVVSRGGNTPFHPDAFSAATITARLSGPIAGTPPQATVLARRQDEDDEAGHDHPGLRLQKSRPHGLPFCSPTSGAASRVFAWASVRGYPIRRQAVSDYAAYGWRSPNTKRRSFHSFLPRPTTCWRRGRRRSRSRRPMDGTWRQRCVPCDRATRPLVHSQPDRFCGAGDAVSRAVRDDLRALQHGSSWAAREIGEYLRSVLAGRYRESVRLRDGELAKARGVLETGTAEVRIFSSNLSTIGRREPWQRLSYEAY
jgi:hypothetical protein